MNLRLVMKNAFMAILTLLAAGLAMLQGDNGFGEVSAAAIYGLIAVVVIMAFVYWWLTVRIGEKSPVNSSNIIKKKKNNKHKN